MIFFSLSPHFVTPAIKMEHRGDLADLAAGDFYFFPRLAVYEMRPLGSQGQMALGREAARDPPEQRGHLASH